jgi:hypothetical protein
MSIRSIGGGAVLGSSMGSHVQLPSSLAGESQEIATVAKTLILTPIPTGCMYAKRPPPAES